jgi:hypothetical protein
MVPVIPAKRIELTVAGTLLYGDDGGVREWEFDGTDEDRSATTNRAQFCPIDRETELWSILGADAQTLLNYDAINNDGLLWPLQHGAVHLDVTAGPEAWVVAYNDAHGRCTVETLGQGQVVKLPFAFQPKPALAPYGRTVLIGPFFRDTSAIQYGGDRPETPASVSVIVDALALPAEDWHGQRVDMVVSRECLWEVARHPDWWERVVGVYVSNEEGQWERDARTVRWLMRELGLPAWPLVSYTTTHPEWAASAEVLGVQAYCEPGEDAAALEARMRRVLPRDRKVALIAQAYDRNGAWTGDLTTLFPVYDRLVRDYANIVMVLAFSDGRRGGMRDHPECYPWLQAMVEAGR